MPARSSSLSPLALALLAACGGGGAPGLEAASADRCVGPACAGQPFSFVVLPDTQFYSEAFPEIFDAQTGWILAERDARRIAFVLHEGDIVNVDDDDQWARAAHSLHALDGQVPYVVAAGNHDYTFRAGHITRECERLNRSFPADALAALPWPTGTFEPGRIENQFQVLDAYGTSYLVLSLEYGPRDAVVAWADEVLSRYATLPAILVTHAYLARGDERFQQQPFHPCGPNPNEFSDCNDGQKLWDKLVSRHDNMVFVFSGHDLFPGVGRLTSEQASGKHVHQMLANYQTCGSLPCLVPGTNRETKGGDGFLRIVTIDRNERVARVESYSPYLDRQKMPAHRTEAGHQFELPLDAWSFRPPEPRAAVAALDEREGPTTVREPLGAPPPRPLPLAASPGEAAAQRCDGLQVVLGGVTITGGPGSPRALRACLDGACESFTVDEALRCQPVRPQGRVSCVDDEGMVRLFFFEARGPHPRLTVTAEDGRGAPLFSGSAVATARLEGGCWSGLHALRVDPPGRGTSRPGI